MPEAHQDTRSQLTWPILLARWTEFAQAAVALPDTETGEKWRAVVPAVVGLQALIHAIGEIDELDDQQRLVGLDKSAVAIRQHTASIHQTWAGELLPEALDELITDARTAWEAADGRSVEWLVATDTFVADHPADLAAMLIESGFAGDLDLPAPGIPLFGGCVAAVLRMPGGVEPDPAVVALVDAWLSSAGEVAEPGLTLVPRQAYRQFDFAKGGPVRDMLAPMRAEPLAGQPLLCPVLRDGELLPVPMPPRTKVVIEPLPVVEFEASATPPED